MSIVRSYFQSKVARRLFTLFLISALLPLITLSSLTFYYIKKQTTKQSQSYVKHLSKSVGMSIYEKLQGYKAELNIVKQQIEKSPSNLLKQYLNEDHNHYQYFNNIGLYRGEQYKAIMSPDKKLAPLSLKYKTLVEGGDTILFHQDAPNDPRIFLAMRSKSKINTSDYIIAELNNDTLWKIQDIIPSSYKLCIFSAANNPLHCNLSKQERSIAEKQTLSQSSHAQATQWQHNETEFMGFYWTIFLEGTFSTDNWRTLVVTPMENTLESRSLFFQLFLPIVALSILLVTFLSSKQIHNLLVPLSELTDTTQKITNGNLAARVDINSSDEFEDLGSSFNVMTQRLEKQFEYLEMITDVDRIILSATDEAYIAEAVLLRIKDILDCNNIKLLLCSQTLSAKTIRAFTKSTSSKHLFDIADKETDLHISSDIDNEIILVDSEHPAPASIIRYMPVHFHSAAIYPLTLQNSLAGIVIANFSEKHTIEKFDLHHVKELCDRLAVALSNASWEEKLYHQANYDETTQLPNRTLMIDRLDQALARSSRNKTQIAVLFLDIDRFKVINDTFSHAAGDMLLQIISQRLSTSINYADTVCRFNGDKFVVLITDMIGTKESINKIRDSVDKLLIAIKHPFTLSNHEISVSASLGIALYPTDSIDRDELLKFSEAAMYHSKSLGTGNYQFYSEDINSKNITQLVLENDLRHAITKNELTLHFQPQVSAFDGKFVGLEALIRWQHAELGLISPAQFLPLVRRIGLMNVLDNWVLETCCKQMRAWLDGGTQVERVAINMSADRFKDSNLIASLDACLETYQLPAKMIDLEITEDTLMADVEATTQLLVDLESRGIKLAIDDFGTGYSSLNYLAKFPLHYLKIDKSFVKDIQFDANVEAIIAATIALAHSLHLTVIAEGVETPEQLTFLQQHDCDIIQGYIVCKPLPADKLAMWVNKPDFGVVNFRKNG